MKGDDLFNDLDQLVDRMSDTKKADDYEWRENPVSLREFVVSKKQLGLPPLSERQYSDIEKVIGTDPKKIFSPSNPIEYGVLVWGKGSGKDWVCSIVQCYVCYILLNLKDPQSYFLFPPDEALDILNVARKGEQAQKIYFTKFLQKIKHWKWLWDRYTLVDKGRILNKRGMPKIEITGTSVVFPNNVRAWSESSQNESFEGYNVIFWVADEISAFTGPTGQKNAKKIFNTLRTSATSRKNRRFKGIGFMISYPRSKEDLILKEYKKFHQGKAKNVYGSYGTPWEVKPVDLFCGEVFEWQDGRGRLYTIPVEYQNDFENEPEDSKTKYLCLPPLTEGGYFEFPERVASILTSSLKSAFEFKDVVKTEKAPDGSEINLITKVLAGFDKVALDKLKSLKVPFGYHADSSKTNHNSVLSIGHKESYVAEYEEKKVLRDRVVVDLVLVWKPDPEKRIQVSIDNIEQVIKTIGKHLPIFGSWDHWGSQQAIERLNRAGISSEGHNVTKEDYGSLRGKIYAGEFWVPDTEETRLGVIELVHLIETGQGKPRESEGYSNDVADTWAGIIGLLQGVKPYSPKSSRAPVGISHRSKPRNDIFTASRIGEKGSVVNLKEVFDKGKPDRLADQREKLLKKLEKNVGADEMSRLQQRPPVGIRVKKR